MSVTRQEAVRLGAKIAMDSGLGLILERHAPNLTVCPACRMPVTAEDRASPKFELHVSCPRCFDRL